MANKTHQQLESRFPNLLQQDGAYRFLRGEEANLESLRSYITSNSCLSSTKNNHGFHGDKPPHIAATSNEEDQKEEENEKTLYHRNGVAVTIQNIPRKFDRIIGQVIITTKRVFFVARDEQDFEKDFAIDAQCISLHAMMTEPDISVYCQLADNDNHEYDEDYEGPVEVIFYLQTTELEQKDMNVDEDEIKKLSTILFESFTKLVNLNPILDDEDDCGAAGGLEAMLGMMGNSLYDDEDDDDDMICRIDSRDIVCGDETIQRQDGNPSERAQMLERLDRLLVVPPQYEIDDGQFDDADESEAARDPASAADKDEDMNDIL